jgi:hypothetical protein
MTGLMFASVLHVSMMAAGAERTYVEAYREMMVSGKPMVILVSTQWCAPCQQMKKHVLPEARKRGVLDQVSFAVVNPDHERDLAHELMDGGLVPQLVMYRHTPQGWRRWRLVGGQSVTSIERFIKQGLAVDMPEHQAPRRPEATSTAARH